MALPTPNKKMTPEEYLAAERVAEFKSEYWFGEVFAMSGATDPHEVICSNLSYWTQHLLRSRNCQVFGSNMKVGVTKRRGFAYPDLSIVCGERQFIDATRDVLMNPIAIFEVLSDSTRGHDMSTKFIEYQKLESLRHYVLLEQSSRVAFHYERKEEQWLYTNIQGDGIIHLSALGIGLPFFEIYRNVPAPPEEE